MQKETMLMKLAMAQEVAKRLTEVSSLEAENAPDDWAVAGMVQNLAEVMQAIEAALSIPSSTCEELRTDHHFNGDRVTVTCHECGHRHPFKYSTRPGALLLFTAPHDCGGQAYRLDDQEGGATDIDHS